ncbi:transcriptional regulator [Klebsiella quasipneumoniae]|nr:transcriptional regulator [Klebsiella quasipneumoniae]
MPGFSAALGLVPASCVRHPSPQGIVSFPLPVSTGVITVRQAWRPRLEQARPPLAAAAGARGVL